MPSLVEGQGCNPAVYQVGNQRAIAIAGGRILVGEYREGKCRAGVFFRIGERPLQNQSVPRRDGHLERSEDHPRPSCLVKRCQSAAEMTP